MWTYPILGFEKDLSDFVHISYRSNNITYNHFNYNLLMHGAETVGTERLRRACVRRDGVVTDAMRRRARRRARVRATVVLLLVHALVLRVG